MDKNTQEKLHKLLIDEFEHIPIIQEMNENAQARAREERDCIINAGLKEIKDNPEFQEVEKLMNQAKEKLEKARVKATVLGLKIRTGYDGISIKPQYFLGDSHPARKQAKEAFEKRLLIGKAKIIKKIINLL